MKFFLKKDRRYIQGDMEIERIGSISKVRKSSAVAGVKDTLAIKAPDISRFVEELKAMPDIRMEKVESVRAQPSLDELAHAIAKEL